MIGGISCLRSFSSACFLKRAEKVYVELYYLKERFNKIEIEIGSKNESQLKRFRKPSLLLTQEESLAEKVKKYPFLLDKSQKTYKERDVLQNFPYPKRLLFFQVSTTFFSKQK